MKRKIILNISSAQLKVVFKVLDEIVDSPSLLRSLCSTKQDQETLKRAVSVFEENLKKPVVNLKGSNRESR